jgi:hypothetical protein
MDMNFGMGFQLMPFNVKAEEIHFGLANCQQNGI